MIQCVCLKRLETYLNDIYSPDHWIRGEVLISPVPCSLTTRPCTNYTAKRELISLHQFVWSWEDMLIENDPSSSFHFGGKAE